MAKLNSNILNAAVAVEDFFRQHGWHYCMIGGLAANRWSKPRGTQDVDYILFTGFDRTEEFVDELLTFLRPRRTDARAFALKERILIAETSEGIPVDISLAAVPFESEVIQRATQFAIGDGHHITTASAEDIILLKAVADRNRDWDDIDRIIKKRGAKLDWAYIDSYLPMLAESYDKLHVIDKVQRLKLHNN